MLFRSAEAERDKYIEKGTEDADKSLTEKTEKRIYEKGISA